MPDKKLFKQEASYDPQAIADLSRSVSSTLATIGEDPSREGLLKTPERVAKSMLFLTQGYQQDAAEILRSAVFEETYDENDLGQGY